MNSSIYRFTLGMNIAQSQISIPVMLGDTGREWRIILSDGGRPYIIADGCLAKISIKRPTGTRLEVFCPIVDNTTIVYRFDQDENTVNTCAVEGVHECDVTLYGTDGKVIATSRFTMVVSERVAASYDVVLTDEDFTAVDAMLTEEAIRQVKETERRDAENARQAAEEKRVIAETERESAEEERIEAEAERIEAENERATKDSERDKAINEAKDTSTEAKATATEAKTLAESKVSQLSDPDDDFPCTMLYARGVNGDSLEILARLSNGEYHLEGGYIPMYVGVGTEPVNAGCEYFTVPVGTPRGNYDAANKDYVDGLTGEIQNRVDTVESIAKGATKGVSFENYSHLISTFNAASKGEYITGQNLFVRTKDVPDLWVYRADVVSHNQYSYTTDESFIADLEKNASVQLGHYLLASLETQKVDLTDYVKKAAFQSALGSYITDIDALLGGDE